MKKLFNKPSWLLPEVNEPIYYFHLLILAAIAIYIVDCIITKSIVTKFDDMFNLSTVFLSIPALLAGDVAAHTLLKLK